MPAFGTFRERAFGTALRLYANEGVVFVFAGSGREWYGALLRQNRLTPVEVREGRSSPWFAR